MVKNCYCKTILYGTLDKCKKRNHTSRSIGDFQGPQNAYGSTIRMDHELCRLQSLDEYFGFW